jgi:hypothetical protein
MQSNDQEHYMTATPANRDTDAAKQSSEVIRLRPIKP